MHIDVDFVQVPRHDTHSGSVTVQAPLGASPIYATRARTVLPSYELGTCFSSEKIESNVVV